MNIPEQPTSPHDELEDLRPQFGALPFDERLDIILSPGELGIELDRYQTIVGHALSEMTAGSTLSELLDKIYSAVYAINDNQRYLP